ncbi:MAG: hypothetical protein KDB88_01070 [Flavobacteriales bacterium]|nr:hypothetical protein [Flavobacteriales bacterium]
MPRTFRVKATITGLLALGLLTADAQNVAINTTGAVPNASAILDLTSTTRGLLIPRMTSAQRIAMFPGATPSAEAMLVYQIDDPAPYNPATAHGLWYYDGAAWVRWSNLTGWSLNGNTGTNAANDFLGTVAGSGDNFVLRTNGAERMRILSTGEIGINTTTPLEALTINGGLRIFRPAPLYPNQYSLTNLEGVIRYDAVDDEHEGNVTNNAAGWRRLENAEVLQTNQDYASISYSCPGAPGTTEGGTNTGQTPAAGVARLQQTPFPTGATAAASGSKVQYLFLASELSAPPFNLCAGLITQLSIVALDDDPNGPPPPGAALNFEIRVGNTLLNTMTNWDPGVSASGARFSQATYIVGGGTNVFPLSPAFNWNGTANIIIEITYKKAGVAGISPRVFLTQGLPFNATRYGYHTTNTVFHGNQFTDAPVLPSGLNLGVNTTRPVFGFNAVVQAGTAVAANADYIQYDGALMIGSAAWAAANYRGPGTVRAENRVVDGITTLSDHVFDRYYDRKVRPEDMKAASKYTYVPLAELEDHLERERHLPSMPSREEWTTQGMPPLGELNTGLWETVETQALYIIELERDLRILEDMAYRKAATDAEIKQLEQDIRDSRRLDTHQKAALLERMHALTGSKR